MPIRITSKKDGFRRAGIAHSSEAKVHEDGTFTKTQIEALKAEPMLVVDEIPGEKPGEKGGKKEGK